VNVRELALRLAVHKALTDQLKNMRSQLDEEARREMEPGDRITAKLPSGEKVGSVTLTHGRVSARVVDKDAFTRWVAERFPAEVVQVVRESFAKTVLDAVKRDGGWVDKATGEIVQVPGVAVTEDDPYPSVRLTRDAPQLIAEAWQRGELAELVGGALQPRELEAGEGS